LLEGLERVLGDNHRLAAVRGELAHRAGDLETAEASYRRALELCGNEIERAHLNTRLAGVQLERP
jgi:RNA polymerase sigma-70 factor (ECF subfamily)